MREDSIDSKLRFLSNVQRRRQIDLVDRIVAKQNEESISIIVYEILRKACLPALDRNFAQLQYFLAIVFSSLQKENFGFQPHLEIRKSETYRSFNPRQLRILSLINGVQKVLYRRLIVVLDFEIDMLFE